MWSKTLRFARVISDNRFDVVLITELGEGKVQGVNLTQKLGLISEDILDVFKQHSYEELLNVGKAQEEVKEFEFRHLTSPVDGVGQVLCAGLNYRDHVKETGSNDKLMIFSKLCDPTTPVEALTPKNVKLLDYEVELGVVLDRELSSVNDFQNAIAGYYVANDITSRCQQIINSTLGTSKGFGHSKSYSGYLPLGPLLAVPELKHKQEFERSLSLRLTVNGEERQQATTELMIYSLDEIVKEIFKLDSEGFSCLINDEKIALLKDGKIPKGTLIISGTPGGTAFQIPSLKTKLILAIKTLIKGNGVEGSDFGERIKHLLVQHEIENGKNYLKSGDVVVAGISGLGSSCLEIR